MKLKNTPAMDQYGIGEDILSLIRTYEDSMRGTGRTSAMMEAMPDRGVFITLHSQEAVRMLRGIQAEYGKTILGIQHEPHDRHIGEKLRGRRYPGVFYDHSLVLEYYIEAIRYASNYMKQMIHPNEKDGKFYNVKPRQQHECWWLS